jgi:hypothetical protein
VFAVGLLLGAGAGKSVLADPPAAADLSTEPKTLPQENFFSSIKQSLRMGYDHEVVRGHFDLGTPPNSHRYYCLVDTRTLVREPNGVLGQPIPLPDGTTALKVDSVSLYGCAAAEKQGMLVTAGYLLKAPAGGATTASTSTSAPTAASTATPTPAATSTSTPTPTPTSAAQIPAPSPALAPTPPTPVASVAPVIPAPAISPDRIDVAEVKLGMSLDEVRAVLKSKKLHEYNEWTETLSYLDSAKGAMRSVANGRFVNVIAAWTAPTAGDSFETAGESFEVMFTPVPGRERAMAIVHSVGYAPANAVREIALDNGLVRKYGGYAESSDLPESATWRYQRAGNVQVGDSCNRRGLFGGLGGLSAASPARENLALKRTPAEFKFQVERCGVAIVTEDHFTANGGALSTDRLVTRFTVTAYSPAIALEGAESAARLIQAAGGGPNKTGATGAADPVPKL